MRGLIALLVVLLASSVQAEQTATSPAPLSPADAVKHMTLPPGFSATLFAAEPDVVQPIAMNIDDRGRLWVAEGNTYPNWDKAAKPDTIGHDCLVILEDSDGDGHFDKRTVFKDDLVNVSGFALGFGGVYVCSTPNLLFIPMEPGTDKPSGPPQVLLDGWNVESAQHNVFNSLTWGPDGWLYGLNGIQSKSAVGKPGTPDEQRVKFDCSVWRYHPIRHEFEVVCWGTTNPWGLDFDDYGQGFITNCVIKHLFHVIPGAHYTRMYGQDYNPGVRQLMESCADHIHWGGGDWTESRGGQGAHSVAGGGHAHVGAMVYLGDNWPAEYRNGLFTCNLHGNRINHDTLEQSGGGYVAHHAADFMFANDTWFRGISILYGPDGGVYVSDWSDTGECHNFKEVDRGNGRIYKITYGKTKPAPVDLAKLSDAELVGLQSHENDWFVRHARRLLAERAAAGKLSPEARPALWRLFDAAETTPKKLRALWAIHVATGIERAETLKLLYNTQPYIRGWAIQLALERRQVSDDALKKLAQLAARDESAVVATYLASALQRLPLEKRWHIGGALTRREESWFNWNLNLLTWYGLEPLTQGATAEVAICHLRTIVSPIIRENLARSAAMRGDGNVQRLVAEIRVQQQLRDVRQDPPIDLEPPLIQLDILRGMTAAFAGQPSVAMPAAWPDTYKALLESNKDNPEFTFVATDLGIIFGDPHAAEVLRTLAVNGDAKKEQRVAAVERLVTSHDAQASGILVKLLSDSNIRGAAIRGLGAIGDPAAPTLILPYYAAFTPSERQDVIETFSTRPDFALALLDALDTGKIPKADLPTHVARQLANLDDERVTAKLEKVWGKARPPTADKAAAIAQLKQRFTPDALAAADRSKGRAVFDRTCAACHTLFGEGGKVGPDLTGSQRANIDYLLENIVDPSANVARDYQMHIVQTADGRTLSGIVTEQSEHSLTLRTTNDVVSLPRKSIKKERTAPVSMMPEGLLDALNDEQRRDLFGYLGGSAQVAPVQ